MALSNKQLLPVSIGIAVQAAVLVLLNAFIPKLTGGMDLMWVSFQAWAVYFLAGCTPMGGVKAWLGYFSGIVASVAIIEIMKPLGIQPVFGMNIAMALAVFIVVIPAIMTENLKNFVPALFIGSGAFFASLGAATGAAETAKCACSCAPYVYAARAVLVYCLVGQIFGWVTVLCRGRYEASLAK